MSKNLIDQNLLDIIVCPKSGKKLTYEAKENTLFSEEAQTSYKIIDGIPRLTLEK